MHPEFAYQLSQVASLKRGLEHPFVDDSVRSETLGSDKGILNALTEVRFNSFDVVEGFRMSPLDTRWAGRKYVFRTKLEFLEDAWEMTFPEMNTVDTVFTEFSEQVNEAINRTHLAAQEQLVKLDLREDAVEHAVWCESYPTSFFIPFSSFNIDGCKLITYGRVGLANYLASSLRFRNRTDFSIGGVGFDPPPTDVGSRGILVDEFYLAPPYDSQDPRYCILPYAHATGPRKRDKKRDMLLWVRRRLGDEKITLVLMGLLCLFGLVGTILAVYQCGPPETPPTTNSNFWSSFAQTNIGIAAIYSVIIPQLQGDVNPVPPNWQSSFKLLLWPSVLTVLLATLVYPWH